MALSIPYTFVPGAPAIAGEVNSNFSAIASWANNANIGTDSLGILQARTVTLPSSPTNTILYLNQTSSNPAIYISNAGTDASLDIVQAGQLASGKAVIKITDNFTQIVSGATEFAMNLAANSTIPALLIKHGSNETFKVTKDHVKLPAITTTERNAITSPQEGAVIFNTTTQELNVRNNSDWTSAGSSSPVGTVVMYAGATAPAGWLICNGDTIPNGSGTVQTITANYSALYAVIGSAYGGAGKLPNLGGIFPKGAGSTTISGKTYTATRGTYTQDSTGPHAHGINAEIVGAPAGGNWGGSGQDFSTANTTIKNYVGGPQKFYQDNRQGVGFGTVRFAMTSNAEQNDAPRAVTGNENIATGPATNTYSGTESQPGNVVLNYIIKY